MTNVLVRKKWDFFVSYASEDRESAANPLADGLTRRGFTVWLDHKVISDGSRFDEQIREGLAECHYGIVIVSPRFLAKDWPMRELDTLLGIETIEGRHRIVVVLHKLTSAELQRTAPELLRKAPIHTDQGFERVCDEVLERVVRAADRERRMTLGELGAVELPHFPGAGLVCCSNQACSWPDRSDLPPDLKAMGPFFTLKHVGQQLCIVCASCGTPAGAVTEEDAKQIAALVRLGNLWKPERSHTEEEA